MVLLHKLTLSNEAFIHSQYLSWFFIYPGNSNIHLKEHNEDLKESSVPDLALHSLSVSLPLISFL